MVDYFLFNKHFFSHFNIVECVFIIIFWEGPQITVSITHSNRNTYGIQIYKLYFADNKKGFKSFNILVLKQ